MLNPIDLHRGWDLSKSAHVKELMAIIRDHRPKLVTLATPCTPWSLAWTVNKPAKEAAQTRDLCLWDLTEKIAMEQERNGRFWLVENPQSSEAWRLKSMQRLRSRKGTSEAILDMCRFGMKDPCSKARCW